MTPELSLRDILSKLETRISFHREREAFHAGQEAHHREQRSLHAAELEVLTKNLETLKAAAATAVDLVSRQAAPPPPQPSVPVPEPGLGPRPKLARMVARVVASKAPGEVFGTAAVTAEVNRRYREWLRRPATARLVSITLRRMLAAGKLRSVQRGRPHHEALYARV